MAVPAALAAHTCPEAAEAAGPWGPLVSPPAHKTRCLLAGNTFAYWLSGCTSSAQDRIN